MSFNTHLKNKLYIKGSFLPSASLYKRNINTLYSIHNIPQYLNFDLTATQMWRNKVADIATKHKDVTFAIADDDQMGQDFKDFGFDDSGEEINIGCFDKNNRKYPMEAMEEWDSDEIEEYLAKFSKGRISVFLHYQGWIPLRTVSILAWFSGCVRYNAPTTIHTK